MTPKSHPQHAHLAAKYDYDGILLAACLDPTRQQLLTAGMDGAVWRLPLAEPHSGGDAKLEQAWRSHENYVAALAVVGNEVISAGYDRQMIWTNAETGQTVRAVEAHQGWIRDMALFADGSRVATCGDDMRVNLWEVKSGRRIHSLAGFDSHTPEGLLSTLYAVAVSPNGQQVAAADRAGQVRVWDTETGKQRAAWRAESFYTFDNVRRKRAIGGVRGLAFSPTGDRLALSGIGQVSNVDGFVGPCRVELWDWQADDRVYVGQDRHNAVLNHLAFLPENQGIVAVGGGDAGGVMGFWDMQEEKPTHKVKPSGHLQHFVVADLGARIYAVGYGGLQVWSLLPKAEGESKEKGDKSAG